MKLLCDTSVLLDVILHREPYYRDSFLALSYCEDESVIALIADTSLTKLFYITHQATHDKELSYQALESILEFLVPVSPTSEEINAAIEKRHRDFEDCLLAKIAEREKCEYVITRNVKDFAGYDFTAITPTEFVKQSL